MDEEGAGWRPHRCGLSPKRQGANTQQWDADLAGGVQGPGRSRSHGVARE